MPKGVRKQLGVSLAPKRGDNDAIVQIDAEYFPNSTIRLPEGVKVRSSHGVQIEFMWKGKRCYETIRGVPTVAHVLDVAKKRVRVMQLIGLGKFEFETEFPDSRKVKADGARVADEGRRKDMTLGAALDDWYVVTAPTVGPNGREDYRKDVRLLKDLPVSSFGVVDAEVRSMGIKTLEHVPVNQISDVSISNFRTWLMQRPGAKSGTTLSYKRILNLLTPLRGALARLATNGTIRRNPFQGLNPLKKANVTREASKVTTGDDENQVDAFTNEEVAKLLDSMHGEFKSMVAFWILTGLRTGELIALKWSDIDWDGGRMHVRRSLSRGILKAPKFDRPRYVDLRPEAVAILKKHKDDWRDNGENWIFVNPGTGRMWADESKIRYRFEKAVKDAGVRYRRPYNCRHTFASMLLSAGEPPLYVAAQMGHKDWGMLITTYGRWIPDVDRSAGTRVYAAQKDHWAKVLNDTADNDGHLTKR